MSHIEPRNGTRHRCSGEIESPLERRLADAVSANHEITILGVGGHNEMQRNWHGILHRLTATGAARCLEPKRMRGTRRGGCRSSCSPSAPARHIEGYLPFAGGQRGIGDARLVRKERARLLIAWRQPDPIRVCGRMTAGDPATVSNFTMFLE